MKASVSFAVRGFFLIRGEDYHVVLGGRAKYLIVPLGFFKLGSPNVLWDSVYKNI